MLQDSVGAGRNSGYYPQSFGTPGNAGGPIGGMQGGMGMMGQPAQRGRPRATSNIGVQGNQNQASGISQWQNNVQASQAPPPTIVDQRSHPGYVSSIPQQSQYVVVDGPQDPGARPTVKGQGLSKQEKKAILDDWQVPDLLRWNTDAEAASRQQKSDKYEAYKASLQKTGRGRSKSQSRFNDGQYISPGGTLAFPQSQSGYGSQPSSDIERAMRSMNIKSQGNDASAQRQAERGRRLSGGVLGLSGSAAQQAQQQAQMEQERRMRERSRSRQPQDETMGAIRPQYMPTGRGNISNINTDSGIINTGQPTVYPTANSQYMNAGVRQEMGHASAGQYVSVQGAAQQNPYGYQAGGQPQVSPAHFGQQLPYQNGGQQPQASPAMYGQQLPQQMVGQQPGVSPAMYGQQLPPQAQFNQSQFVPVTTVGGIATMGIPVGHINQFPAFAQGQIGVSPMPSPIDGGNMAPYLTPAFINQPMPQAEQQPTRRKANIANVMNSQQQQQQQQQQQFQQYVPNPYINPKTILTPAPPPKQLHTSNINNINNAGVQPQVQTRNRALSQSGYVTGAPSSQPSVGAGNRNSAYINPSGSGVENNTAYPTRPGLGHNDSLQTTGPQGFGSRPSHTREPSYKATIKPTSQGSRPDSETQRSGVPVVSMRRPNPEMHPQRFTPKVISYDLNGEHRQDVPLRFGKFIYERDCTHEGKFEFPSKGPQCSFLHTPSEWHLFTQQILETWADRNPAYNYYHSAVKRIDAILSAWNFAFFHPRGMDVVLFKGNERRSGPRFGEPEASIDFLPEASPVSDDEEDSSEESDDEENPMTRLASQNPQYRAQVEREKQARRAYRAEEKRREAAAKPLEAPHSLVIYEIAMPTGNESYR